MSSVENRLRIGLFRHCGQNISLPWNDPGRDPRCVDADQRNEKRRSRYKNQRQKSLKASAASTHSNIMSPRQVLDNEESLASREAIPAPSRLNCPPDQDPRPTDEAQWNGQALEHECLTNLAENTSDCSGLDQFADGGGDIDFPGSDVFQLPESDFFHVDIAFPSQ